MSEEGKFIECDKHGKQQETFVCQHIVQTILDGKIRGFWSAGDSDNPRPDAWCSECDANYQASGGVWNDENEAFAGIKIICGACYDQAKEINFGSKKNWWQIWK